MYERGENPEQDLGTNLLIYVTNSANRKPPRETEVSLGKSVFKPNVTLVMDRGKVGPLRTGERGTLVIYPDGTEGKRIAVSIRIPESSDSDDRSRIVDVAISDESVRVLGECVLSQDRRTYARF